MFDLSMFSLAEEDIKVEFRGFEDATGYPEYDIIQTKYDRRAGFCLSKVRKQIEATNVSKRTGETVSRKYVMLMYRGKIRRIEVARIIYAWYSEQGISDHEIVRFRDNDRRNMRPCNMYTVECSDAMKERYKEKE